VTIWGLLGSKAPPPFVTPGSYELTGSYITLEPANLFIPKLMWTVQVCSVLVTYMHKDIQKRIILQLHM
jgi:hypothetical protein